MSRLMDSGVIRMPYELATGSEMAMIQYYDRANSILDKLEAIEKRIADAPDIVIKKDYVIDAETMEPSKYCSTQYSGHIVELAEKHMRPGETLKFKLIEVPNE